MSTVQNLSRLLLNINLWRRLVRIRHHHLTLHARGVEQVLIRVGVFTREESCLGMTFTICVNHAAVGAWTLTLSKMDDVLVFDVCLGIHLLTSQSLLEQCLLLDLLLLVGQNWVLAGIRILISTVACHHYVLSFGCIWCWNVSDQSTVSVCNHHGVCLTGDTLLDRRSVHAISY